VSDPERSAAFYAGVLGLPEARRLSDESGLRAIWLLAGRTVLMLERELRGAGAASGSGHLLAFGVRSLEEWAARLAERGLRVEDRTEHTLYLRDPDGHRVGLSDFEFRARPA
jgi:catechol 2,3-dioxygenase-like lactoylglutathione lyase family enzyme